MPDTQLSDGVVGGRLTADEYAHNFDDLHPPLDNHEALVESDRCYFCFDAPCVTACPTSIDIPQFIRQINTGNPSGSAQTILSSNIMGGMCARVCPTETLCEEVCVRNVAEEKPVLIGLLQRYATDHLMRVGVQPFERQPATGKHIGVVGGGPAGLSCAHRLACLGHQVSVYEAREKLGGLNEFGLAAYKTVDNFAQAEIEFILSIGGIDVVTGRALGADLSLEDLTAGHDALFLAMGLGDTGRLGLDGENEAGVEDAVDFISRLRQSDNLSELAVGRRVVVIGGGMTAIDIAVQTKKLGAEEVTMVYRRGPEQMNASKYECHIAQTNGVAIRHWAAPSELQISDEQIAGITFAYQELENGQLRPTGQSFTLAADQVFRAIGQSFVGATLGAAGIDLDHGRIKVDGEQRTSLAGIWAGGDCVNGGDDLTVSAVEDGKVAANSIHASLTSGS